MTASDKGMPVAVRRELSHQILVVRRSVLAENEALVRCAENVGLTYCPPDTLNQEKAVAAAQTAVMFKDHLDAIYIAAGVSRATFYRYYAVAKDNHDASVRPVDLVRHFGRKQILTIDLDIALAEWIDDPEVPQLCKGMSGMKKRYRQLIDEKSPLDDLFPVEKPPAVSEETLRLHIKGLLKQKGLVLKKPRTMDIERLRIFDSLNRWWHDAEIRALISSVNPMLLFNADETSVCMVIESLEKLVSFDGSTPWVPSLKPGGNHTTLFPIISAAGQRVTPTVILHSERKEFVKPGSYHVATYRTENGYMDQVTFVKILEDVFIPYVQMIRRSLSGNKLAVLIVDGHSSRYSVEAIELLLRNNIVLLVLPPHTSHVAQPLDLTLNHLIKLFFRRKYLTTHPVIPLLDTTARGRPSKARKPACESEGDAQAEPSSMAVLTDVSASMCQIYNETPEETEERVSKAVYRRAKLVDALIRAYEEACSIENIRSAWRSAHLRPLLPDPPYTMQREESLILQAKTLGIVLPPESERKKEHIYGILTRESVLEELKARKEASSKRGRPRRHSAQEPCEQVHDSERDENSSLPNTSSAQEGSTFETPGVGSRDKRGSSRRGRGRPRKRCEAVPVPRSVETRDVGHDSSRTVAPSHNASTSLKRGRPSQRPARSDSSAASKRDRSGSSTRGRKRKRCDATPEPRNQ